MPSELTREVRDEIARCARLGVGDETAALMCSALRPEGPGADPALKDLSAFATFSAFSDRGVGKAADGRDGGGPTGCLSRIEERASAEDWSIPELVKALAARLNWPS